MAQERILGPGPGRGRIRGWSCGFHPPLRDPPRGTFSWSPRPVRARPAALRPFVLLAGAIRVSFAGAALGERSPLNPCISVEALGAGVPRVLSPEASGPKSGLWPRGSCGPGGHGAISHGHTTYSWQPRKPTRLPERQPNNKTDNGSPRPIPERMTPRGSSSSRRSRRKPPRACLPKRLRPPLRNLQCPRELPGRSRTRCARRRNRYRRHGKRFRRSEACSQEQRPRASRAPPRRRPHSCRRSCPRMTHRIRTSYSESSSQGSERRAQKRNGPTGVEKIQPSAGQPPEQENAQQPQRNDKERRRQESLSPAHAPRRPTPSTGCREEGHHGRVRTQIVQNVPSPGWSERRSRSSRRTGRSTPRRTDSHSPTRRRAEDQGRGEQPR